MNQPLPTLLMHMHWIVFSYAPFTQSKVDMSVIIFPLARSLHDLITLSYLQPHYNCDIDALGKSDGIQNHKITDLYGHLLLDSMDPALPAGLDDDNDEYTSHEDTSLAGVQGYDTSLAGVPIPTTTITTMTMMTQTQNLITTLLTPMRWMTIQAKHLYTALEATYQFTVQLVNHHNILWMKNSWTT